NHDNLENHAAESSGRCGFHILLILNAVFDFVFDFLRTLIKKEESAQQQNQTLTGDIGFCPTEIESEPGLLHTDQPTDSEQKGNPHEHREEHTEFGCFFPLIVRKFSGNDRNENDVVDTEDDLKEGQCEECNPRIRIGEKMFNH